MLPQSRKRSSRRDFLKAAGTAAVFSIIPRHVIGGPKQTPPSEKLNIACVGAGGRGARNVDRVSKNQNIVALCDVDLKRAAETFKKFPNAKKYSDFRKMLQKEQNNIDAVVVSTPDHTHAVATMAAIQAGKHVYCEKPLTRSIYEARQIAQAAKKANVATQMGIQMHAAEELRVLVEALASGVIGDVREVHVWIDKPGKRWPHSQTHPKETPPVPATLDWDLWLGPAPYRPYHPLYTPFNWRGWRDFGTGALGDMGCHLFDPAFWALNLGYPETVRAQTKGLTNETYPAESTVIYRFPARKNRPPVTLIWYDGPRRPPKPQGLEMPSLPKQGAIFVGQKATILWPKRDPSIVITKNKITRLKPHEPYLPRCNSHLHEWYEACKGGPTPLASFDGYAGRLTEVVLLGTIAQRLNARLLWDGPNMKITNCPEAKKLIQRTYREGWHL